MPASSALATVEDFLRSQVEQWLPWFRTHVDVPLKVWTRIPRWILVSAAVTFTYYKYCTWNYKVFKKMGINGPKPYPILGTSYLLMKKGITGHDMEMQKYGTLVGTFQGRDPLLMVYDVDLVKQIMIKDFTSFPNRYFPKMEEYAGRRLLFLLKGEHWKHVRNILTPTFSSGKLRRMDKKILHCAQTLTDTLQKKAENNETFDLRELCSAFTMDVIASTAFGIQINSQNDPLNPFVKMGIKAFSATFTSFNIMLVFFFPFLARPLQKLGIITVFPRDAVQFFTNAVDKIVETRKAGAQQETDFMQLMMDAHAEGEAAEQKTPQLKSSYNRNQPWADTEKGLSHEDLLAQGLMFFLAGFETTANTLSLLGHSLATNPECQEKLLKEIDEVMKDQAHANHDLVNKMLYLEMCINETLRLYPPGPRTDRVAEEDAMINGIPIPKGMIIGIPIYVFHMDPEVWPNPTKWDPERFSNEEKESRNPYYFLPFGSGPRNCVGMRLAMTEMKIAAVTILRHLKFVTCPETQFTPELDTLRFKPIHGLKLRVEKRHIM